MGTTLTGTTPQDTYDSLIKVTDNGPLSGTAKYLSDGLGNDSVLALSNARVGVATTSPSYPLTIVGDTGLEGNESYLYFHSTYSIGNNARARMRAVGAGGGSGYGGDLRIDTRAQNNTWNTDVVTVANTGNVGIGTSSPSTKFVVSNAGAAGLEFEPTGLIQSYNRGTGIYQTITLDASNVLFRPAGIEIARFTANGLTFNGDTAAANALDDYEEGTFTPTLNFGGASVGVTYGTVAGKYTKIGNLVNFSIRMTLTSKGSSTGAVRIAGLPFTAVNTGNADFTSLSIGALQNITFADFPMGLCIAGTDYLVLEESPSGGFITALTNADFQNDSVVRVGGFYYTA